MEGERQRQQCRALGNPGGHGERETEEERPHKHWRRQKKNGHKFIEKN